MNLTVVAESPDPARVRCEGDISLTDLPPGADPLAALLGGNAYARRVVVDLGRATFIDSGGISLLIIWQKRFRRDGGRITLYNVPSAVRQVLDLLNLKSVLSLADDEASAAALALGDR